jgi:hypothetical protein
MVDLSLDEVTVHWCGYSKQQLGEPYRGYESRTLAINSQFLDEFLKAVANPHLASQLLQSDTKYAEQNECYSESIIAKMVLLQIPQRVQQAIGSESPLMEFKYELHNSDERIVALNLKAKIPQLILNRKELFRIWPIPHNDEIAHCLEGKTANKTMDNSKDDCYSEESVPEDKEYHSDNEDPEDIFE